MPLLTTTLTVPAACDGVVTLMVLPFGTATFVPVDPPNVTVAPGRKPVPVITTDVPPLVVPEFGEMPFTVNVGVDAPWLRNVAICVTHGAEKCSGAVTLYVPMLATVASSTMSPKLVS